MTDLNKYNENRPESHGLLKGSEKDIKRRKKKEKKYIHGVSIMLSECELEAIEKVQEETGASKSTIIRRFLKKGGLF